MTSLTVKDLMPVALNARHRLFEAVLNLEYDSLPYIGHLITKVAIEKGYTEKHKKNLKGNTVAVWARTLHTDGKGAPNRWACLAATDLLVSHKAVPDVNDVELWSALIFHWDAAHGPFDDLKLATQSLCLQLGVSNDILSMVEAALKQR